MRAGLPNITGQLNVYYRVGYAEGAFTPHGVGNNGANAGSYGYAGATLDASRSSSVYGSSTTVTPLSLSTKFFIKY